MTSAPLFPSFYYEWIIPALSVMTLLLLVVLVVSFIWDIFTGEHNAR